MCFGFLCCCCDEPFKRKPNPKEKMKALKLIEEISESNTDRVVPVTSDPTATHLHELTDVIELPKDNIKTEEEFIAYKGYRIDTFIDSGAFAEVYKGIHLKKGLTIACKQIYIRKDKKKPKLRLKDIKNELYILQKTKHPHIIRLLEHFILIINNTSTLYVFMQFATGGSLSNLIKSKGPIDEKTCRLWFAQLLSALILMHKKGIAHRDLKLGNVLLDESQDVLISDFGLSRIAYRESKGGVLDSKTYCGTPAFMAPELLCGPGAYNAFAVDVWALGTILYVLFNNRYPFPIYKEKSRTLKLMKNKKWEFSNKNRDQPSDGLKGILNKIFEANPKLRPTMKSLSYESWVKNTYQSVEMRCKALNKQFVSLRDEPEG